ncbi:MAG: AAA family ATPase [Acidimicrobiaceae bacterium]|nr:AAA family ATPase [Acidimicrobiaceae bacterium]
MDDEQYWMQRLDEYLHHREHVEGKAKGTVEDDKAIVGQWITFSLEQPTDPAARDTPLLDYWVTEVKDLVPGAQDGYRAHVRQWWKQWWKWNEEGSVEAETAADVDPASLVLSARLARMVTEFRRSTGYPHAGDEENLRVRERFEAILRGLPTMLHSERQLLKEVWRRQSGADYGGPGQIVQLSSFVDRLNEAGWERLRGQITALCFSGEALADRLETAVGEVDGMGWTTATRLAAISDPQRVIPNYSLYNAGRWAGKLDSLQMLTDEGLLEDEHMARAEQVLRDHPRSRPSGRAVVESNDLLLEILRPHFTDGDSADTWGMRTFLYWLAWENRPDEPAERWVDEADLEMLAGELLCEVDFLEEVVGLLEDKGQVILYGPPGTGKTYFAQRLARTLAGIQDDEWYDENGPYSLVQFHPAYSYEDFFEGFRPQVKDGQMTYKLTAGPLVRLAERAAEHPDKLHVMVIDEINRANLPRVLGELLYLLEYRDEWTQTQYRPDDGFELPSNLWFIGTMNTADRSIALIDAAMRRRFHFVPFFPNRPPSKELLQRWTQQHAPDQTWVAELLDKVNGELEEMLGGDHLLIGPSHFMKPALDEASVRRIWTYNIEPLIEDQLFGQHDAIERFRFDKVMQRHGPDADGRRTGDSSTGDGSAGTEGPSGDGAGDLVDGPDDG